MPITVLQLEEEGPLLAFETMAHILDPSDMKMLEDVDLKDDDLVIAKYLVDTKMNPISKKQYTIATATEEIFHTELRKQACDNCHLITSHSTDPEWTPDGYSKILTHE
jgi:hypothetical protein